LVDGEGERERENDDDDDGDEGHGAAAADHQPEWPGTSINRKSAFRSSLLMQITINHQA